MGYAITYKFHREKSKGEYDKDKVEESTVAVGQAHEDVSLDILAGKVMALLARRNILVSEIQISEMVKKPITFKEFEDGIVIKNRKYRFDDGSSVVGSECVSEVVAQDTQTTLHPHELINRNTPAVQKTVPSNISGKPIRFEYYQPESEDWIKIARLMNPKYVLTVGKKYPIYKEKVSPKGMIYTIVDDKGITQDVIHNMFNLVIPKLDEQGVIEKKSGLSDDGLMWSGVENDNIPDLRKKR